MKKKLVFLVIFIFLLFPSILSECDSDQIDINNASESELTKIDGVGSSTAKKIISKRPFNSLDGLKRVDGRGTSIEEGKLEKIKQQGLACVENSSENSGESEEENNSKNNDENDSTENLDYKFKEVNEDEDKKKDKKPIMRDVIKLSSPSDSAKESEKKNSSDPKTIKNPNSFNFQENKSKYANYGLLVVMVIVLSSMLTKYKKNKYKNEFRE